ncbi:hypothetical protein [Bradyrhizobium sp. 174]|nr:hypothetical protein [Bradyrhizobium sp. 174]
MKAQALSHLRLDVASPKPISIEDTNRSPFGGSSVVQVVMASSC